MLSFEFPHPWLQIVPQVKIRVEKSKFIVFESKWAKKRY
jgi:hypothetical protein